MTWLRANASATASPDDTMSAPSPPRTARTPFWSPFLAALTSASAASSAVLKDCCAIATDAAAKASITTMNDIRLACDRRLQRKDLIIAYSIASGSGVLQADLVVEHPEVAITTANDRLRHDCLHVLCDDADVS